eukprot:Tbor_TRINITY_DN3906_c0_g1::TRINITY_DN3906_c0_g1_i1::g.855::m.855
MIAQSSNGMPSSMLESLKGKRVSVVLNNNRIIVGVLFSYDNFCNIMLSGASERSATTPDADSSTTPKTDENNNNNITGNADISVSHGGIGVGSYSGAKERVATFTDEPLQSGTIMIRGASLVCIGLVDTVREANLI